MNRQEYQLGKGLQEKEEEKQEEEEEEKYKECSLCSSSSSFQSTTEFSSENLALRGKRERGANTAKRCPSVHPLRNPSSNQGL
jgi:hypothetical protein